MQVQLILQLTFCAHSEGSSMNKRRRVRAPHGLPVISLSAINELTSNVTSDGEQEMSAPPGTMGSRSAGGISLEPKMDHTTNRPWLASRRDTPICNFTRKAKRCEDVSWTRDQQQLALDNLVRDYTSVSAKGPAASVLKTWDAMHRRMHSDHIPAYPLTAEKIARVAAAFKACGYRSFANYLSKAKEHHIEMFQVWGPELALEARRSTRSVTRGIGPVAQRTPLDIERIMTGQIELPLDWRPLVMDGPMGPHHMAVTGTFFMLREAEASLLLCANVRIDSFTRTVTLKLPSSKTDAAAASADRSWGCLCATHQEVGCPYHLAVEHHQVLLRHFGEDQMGSISFFPTMEGSTVEKVKVVETFEALHSRLNIPFLDEDGNKLRGGHSMRLAGARLLSAAGLRLYQVELMARWKSPMLIHYAQSAPLKRVTQE